jgi:hypothetical protein
MTTIGYIFDGWMVERSKRTVANSMSSQERSAFLKMLSCRKQSA